MSLPRVLALAFGAWCLFILVFPVTGHDIDPVSTAAVIFIYVCLLISARSGRGDGFRPKVKLVVSAEERGAQRKRQRIPRGLEWWYRLNDRLHWLDDAAWPDGIAWPAGKPMETRQMRPVIHGTLIGSVLVVLAILGANVLDAPLWVALPLGLVVGLGPLSGVVA